MTSYAVLARVAAHHIIAPTITCTGRMPAWCGVQMRIAQTRTTPTVVLNLAYAKVIVVLLPTSADL